jgi:hypothetical protein
MFEAHLEPIVRRAAKIELGVEKPPLREGLAFKLGKLFSSKPNQTPLDTRSASDAHPHDVEDAPRVNSGNKRRVHAGMIRRMSDAPQRVNPSGLILEETKRAATAETPPLPETPTSESDATDSPGPLPQNLERRSFTDGTPSMAFRDAIDDDQQPASRAPGQPFVQYATTSSRYTADPHQLSARRFNRTGKAPSVEVYEREEKRTTSELPRTATIEFAGFPQVHRRASASREQPTGAGMTAPTMSLTKGRDLWRDRIPRQYSTMGEPGSALCFVG